MRPQLYNNLGTLLALIVVLTSIKAEAATVPFSIRPQNPFIQIFGIPSNAPSTLTDAEGISAELFFDFTNNSGIEQTTQESFFIDGESYRTTLMLRKRLSDKFEIAIELPFTAHAPGKLDNFIEKFHDTLGFSNYYRHLTPSNTLDYSYSRNDSNNFSLTEAQSGISDITLHGGYQLYRDDKNNQALSLRAGLKLPTGESSQLLGSDAYDLSIYLSGSDNQLLESLGLDSYAQVGLAFLSEGNVLPTLQKSVVAFSSIGIAWQSGSWYDLKAQLNAHSSVYNSSIPQLGGSGIQLTVGGTLYFGKKLALDIGIGENLSTDTTPDFLINLAFRITP